MENQELGLWIHYNSLQLDRECISRNHYEVSLHQISLKSFQKRTDEKQKKSGIISIYFCLYSENLYNSFSHNNSSFFG